MSYVERLVVTDETKATMLYDEHIIRYRFVAPLAKAQRVLDIASGSGYGTALLKNAGAATIVGVDADFVAVREAQESYPGIDFQIGDAGKLSFENKSFDLITSFETIEHLPDVSAYLEELKRVLADKGLVCISTPNRNIFGQKSPFHIKEYTREEFEALLRNYFSYVHIFDQKNALASFISAQGETCEMSINDSKSEALYFIAICSQREISEKFESVTSMNVAALERWEKNPGWKLINSLYRVLQKLKIRN